MDNLLALAISTASHAHRHQVDRRGEPYILHPLRVMQAVRDAGFDETHQIVALFHDVLEDTFAPKETLIERFGKHIMDAVDFLTRRYAVLPGTATNEFGAKLTGEPLETYQHYFERCVQNPIARVVKYFDLLDNADPKRFTEDVPYARYIKGLLWFREQEVMSQIESVARMNRARQEALGLV